MNLTPFSSQTGKYKEVFDNHMDAFFRSEDPAYLRRVRERWERSTDLLKKK